MNNYPEHILNIVWQRANIISPDNETKGFRKDNLGRWIKRQDFNQAQQEFGWVLSKEPASINELTEDRTIVPLHWRSALFQTKQQQIELSKFTVNFIDKNELEQLIKSSAEALIYWQSATLISSDNEQKGYRKDYYGQWIQKDAFGDSQHQYGWTLAYLVPISEKALIQPKIIPVHIHTQKRLAYEVAPAQENTEEKIIKRRRENVALFIITLAIDLITALPRALFSIFKG